MSTTDSTAALMSTVERLLDARLAPAEWHEVEVLARRGHDVATRPDPTAIDSVAAAMANVMFRARVRRRLGGGPPSPAVAPTKQSVLLPIVGIVCASVVVALGWRLGGGALLAGTVALGLFVLGVALAGTHTVTRRRGSGGEPAVSAEEPAPPAVRRDLELLGAMLRTGSPGA